MARPLTARQQQVYDFIHDRISTRGYGPTVREIGEFIGIKSPNGVMCHLRALERKGMINRLANKSRAIEIANNGQAETATQTPRVANGSLSLRGCVTHSTCSLFAAPQPFDLMGVFDRTQRYLLQYNGDNLLDQSINNGDMLVIEPTSAGTGENIELLQSTDGSIELRVPNEHEDDRPAAEGNGVVVIGVVVGVLRLHHQGAGIKPPHLLRRKAQRAS